MSPRRPQAPEPRLNEGRTFRDAKTVLVVARDAAYAGSLIEALQSHDLPAVMTTNSAWGLYWLRQTSPALVVLDLSAQGAKILLYELRRQARHVIALSDDPAARGVALSAGCVEALHASDTPAELALHIATRLRTRHVQRTGRIVAGTLIVDLTQRRLSFDGREVRVSALLLDLVAYLAARPGHLISARALLEEVWGEPWADIGKVHVAMLRLRRALGLTATSRFLVARHGHGYGFFFEDLARSDLVLHRTAERKESSTHVLADTSGRQSDR